MSHSPFGAVHQQWLRLAGISLGARISQYDHARYNALVASRTESITGADKLLEFQGSRWSVAVAARFVDEKAGTLDLELSFLCTEGSLEQASLSIALELRPWSVENYVLLPSSAYQGNRFASRRLRYSPKLHEVQDIGPDKPMVISDIPRLALGAGVSRIQERSASLASPALGVHFPSSASALWILSPQGNHLGDFGIDIEESRDRDASWVHLSSPVVRELNNYRICDNQAPSLDRGADFKAGDRVVLSCRIHFLVNTDLQGLFDAYSRRRKELLPTRSGSEALLPYSACFELQEQKFNTCNFVPEHGYYSVGLRENFLQDWQIGWTGGMISTYPLLFSGTPETRANVLRNFDWLFPAGLCPAGFFWDSGRNGTEWIGGDIRKPHTGNWHLIRKSGDGVYYILKQFDLMEKQGPALKDSWLDGVKGVCEALVRLWVEHGQFGQFVDSLTGKVIVGGSASGAIIPAALVLAWKRYGDDHFLDTALKSGEYYYREFTQKGLCCGGPGDALQNNDSESWYSLVESYVYLFEATGDPVWLQRAAEQSRQFSTWVVAYDYPFPKESLFGQAGIRSTGAVYANTQNKHAAPGLCTFSGLAFFKLFRATGDRYHLELLHDIAHNIPQYLPHPAKPLGKIPFGRVCERVNLTDWEGPEKVGQIATPGTWAETSLMLTTMEIPGVYVQTDTGFVHAFDCVEVKRIQDGTKNLLLELHNPTPVAARVRIFAETSAAARSTPLQENYLFSGKVLEIPAGESRSVTLIP